MKVIQKNYYVCEICGKTSRSEDKIRECQESHLIISDECEIDAEYVKGGTAPGRIVIKFPDGTVATYMLVSERKKGGIEGCRD